MASLPDYAELHCLSNFSFLRGASHPEELVAQAVAQGYTALALTDECSLAGVVRAHLAAKEAGLKLIIGSEMTTTMESTAGPRVDGLKLVFLAKNREGYGNLSALITLARRRAAKGCYTLQRHDLNVVSPNGALPDCLVLWVPGEMPVADDGRWLAMKGIWPEDEIGRLPDSIAVDAVHRLAVPGVDGERHLVVLRCTDAQRRGES